MWHMNNAWLADPNDSVYQVIHHGKEMQFSRVTTVLEQTQPTPFNLKRWMVNCGADALSNSQELHNNLLDPSEVRKLAWEAHQVESKNALRIGSAVHHHIQHGTTEFVDKDIYQAMKAYTSFSCEYLPQPLGQEITLYDTQLKVAGTIDWIGTIKGSKDVWILDWKTSKAVSHSYLVQLSVYKKMFLSFLKSYKKAPPSYSLTIQSAMSNLILHSTLKSANPKIRIAIVRLDKHVPKRESTLPKYEFVEVTPNDQKVCLKEFELALKVFNYRKDKYATK
jgi:hypothetical protein